MTYQQQIIRPRTAARPVPSIVAYATFYAAVGFTVACVLGVLG